MKPAKHAARLKARRKAFDDMREPDKKNLGFNKRPGSLKK